MMSAGDDNVSDDDGVGNRHTPRTRDLFVRRKTQTTQVGVVSTGPAQRCAYNYSTGGGDRSAVSRVSAAAESNDRRDVICR